MLHLNWITALLLSYFARKTNVSTDFFLRLVYVFVCFYYTLLQKVFCKTLRIKGIDIVSQGKQCKGMYLAGEIRQEMLCNQILVEDYFGLVKISLVFPSYL